MESTDVAPPLRREFAPSSLALGASAEVERQFRDFMGSLGGSFNEWDQRFLDFLVAHADERLLTGVIGAGFHFAFSARDSVGFWVLSSRDGAKGKGFLNRHDAARILELARADGLVR